MSGDPDRRWEDGEYVRLSWPQHSSRLVRVAFESLGSGERVGLLNDVGLPADEIMALPPHEQIREVARRVLASDTVEEFLGAAQRIKAGEYVRPQRPGRYLSPDQDAHLRPMDYQIAQAHLDAHRTKDVIIVHLQAMHGIAGGPSDIDGLREMHAKDHRVVPPGSRGGVAAMTEQIKAEHLKAGLRVRLVKARGVDLEGEPVLVVKTAKLIDSRMVPLARYVRLEFEDGTRFDIEAWAIFELVSLIIHALRSEDPDEPIEIWCDAEGATVENTSNLIDQVTCGACKTALDNAPGMSIGVDLADFNDATILDGARGLRLRDLAPAGNFNEVAVQCAEVAWRRGLISTQEHDWLVNTMPKVRALVKDIPDRGHHAPGLVTEPGDFVLLAGPFEGKANIELEGLKERIKLHALLDAMVQRKPVRVLADMKNGIGEITDPAGWTTMITEIRRPALPENIAAYGHLDPVIKVDGSPTGQRGLTIALRPDQVEIVDG